MGLAETCELDLPPEAETELHEAQPKEAPNLERGKKEDDDSRGVYISKKNRKKERKKKVQMSELELEPEPVKELDLQPESEKSKEQDLWGFTGSKKTKDKKEGKKVQTLESEFELGNKDEFRDTWGTSKPEADPKLKPLEEVAPEEEVEAAPTASDDWSFCEPDSEETKLQSGCILRQSMYLGMAGRNAIAVMIFYANSAGRSRREELEIRVLGTASLIRWISSRQNNRGNAYKGKEIIKFFTMFLSPYSPVLLISHHPYYLKELS